MKKTFLGIVGMCSVVIAAGLVIRYLAPVNVTTAQCPSLAPITVVERVMIGEEWRCEEPKRYMDLLQPSGLWINKQFDCWKLEQPIEEYCKTNPCASNNYLRGKSR